MAIDLDRLEEILENLVDRLGGIPSGGGGSGGGATRESKADADAKKYAKTVEDLRKSFTKFNSDLKRGNKPVVDLISRLTDLDSRIVNLTKTAKTEEEREQLTALKRERREARAELLEKNRFQALSAFNKAIGATFVSGVWNATKTLVKDLQSGGSGIQLAADLMGAALDTTQSGFTAISQAGQTVGSGMIAAGGKAAKLGTKLAIGSAALEYFTSAVTSAAKEGVNLLAAEADKTIKAFNNSTAAGALFGRGMDDVRKYATRAGLTVDQFSEVIKNNNQALAESGLTVETAARGVADVTSRLAKDTGKSGLTLQKEMLNLGVGFQEQADIVAQVMVGYKRAGMTANNKELATATVEMAKNTKAMADILGDEAKTRQESAKKQAEQYAFQVKLNELARKYGDPTLPMKAIQALGLMSDAQREAAIQATVLDGAVTNTSALLMDGGDAARIFSSSLQQGQTDMKSLLDGTTRLNDRLQSGTDEMGRALSVSAIAIGANAEQNKAFSEQYRDSFMVNSNNLDKAVADANKLSGAQGGLQGEITGVEAAAQSLKMSIQNELTPTIKKFSKVANEVLDSVHNAVNGLTKGSVAGDVAKVGMGTWVAGAVLNALGFAADMTGIGAAVGVPLNMAGTALMAGGSTATMAGTVGSAMGFAEGGIASGPVSGFATTLHGTEAVVPLPDGKTIPVETKQVGPSYDTKIMADMLQELKNGHQSTIQAMNELVRHTKTTASYSSQLVQLAS